jgi:hypothetical protein
VVLAWLAAAPSVAAPASGTKVRFINGSCAALVVAGRRGRSGCQPQLVNVTYRSGLISFVFRGGDGQLISFRGRIGHQVGSQTTLKIGHVTTLAGSASRAVVIPASGSCVLTAFSAVRSRLECAAQARGRRYAALFQASAEPHVQVVL